MSDCLDNIDELLDSGSDEDSDRATGEDTTNSEDLIVQNHCIVIKEILQ